MSLCCSEKAKLVNESISIITDETTDYPDHSILNIIASIRGESFLIDVVTLSECNHQTVSQACIRVVTHVDIEFEKTIAFITDSAAYCKKAHSEVLLNIFNNSYHVLCLVHILNLVSEVFSHWPAFDNVTQFTTFIKSAFFRRQSQKKKNDI